uniref:Chromosome 11 open reading frame 52 n=1 Tax=Coturnix japonica TaxID=93934 RepID=A0A8C2YCP9_COTJA
FSKLTSLSDSRNCPSLFKRKKKKQGKDLWRCCRVQEQWEHQLLDSWHSSALAADGSPKNTKQDDSIHYADIQVFTKVRERSAEEVKNLQMQNATEYATLNFPRPRLKYDSKNGTLV